MRWGDRRRVWVYVVLTVIALSACGPGRGSTLGPRRHLELAAGAQGRASAPVAAAAGPLAPGKYYTSLFEPTFTYTVGDGWGLVAETDGLVFLGRDVGSERQGLIVTIVSPTKADTLVLRDPIYRPEQSPRSDLRRSLPMPDDYIAYLAQQDELTVSEVEPATLLGREGTVASVAVTDRPGGLPCPPTVSCLALLLEQQPEVTRHGFFAGERERVWDLGAGNDRLIVMVRISATVADSSDQLLQDALGVLATVSFA